MKVCTCILLFRIFANTYSIAQNPARNNQKSVNLALETVLEFHNKDNGADVRFLDTVQKFIAKIKTVIDKNKNRSFRRHNAGKVPTFTDFIQQVVSILNTYDDNTFEDFFSILDKEIRKYHYRGCKFYELTENYEIRTLLAEKLKLIQENPVPITKMYLNGLATMLRDENYGKNVQELVVYINSLYQDTTEKFYKFISDLEYYKNSKSKRNDPNLTKIIKDGVRSIIFDHYTNLNRNARRELKNKIESFWNQIKENNTSPTTNEAKKSEPVKNELVNQIKTTLEMVENKKYDDNKADGIDIETSLSWDVENEKKEYNNARGNNLKIKGNEEKLLPSDQVEYKQQKTNNKNQEQSGLFSTEEALSGLSFERNSIEISQERQREYNTQRYVTLYTEALTYRPTTLKKQENMMHGTVKVKTIKPRQFQKVWTEETIEILPTDLHVGLTKKSNVMHKTKLKQYESKNKEKQESQHEEKYNKTHDKRYKQTTKHETKHHNKHNTKHDKKQSEDLKVKSKFDKQATSDMTDTSKLKDGNGKLLPHDVRSKSMDLYDYKKRMGPIRQDLKEEITRKSLINSKTSPPTRSTRSSKPFSHRKLFSASNKSPAPIRLSPTTKLQGSKRYKILSGKQNQEYKSNPKSALCSSQESVSIEKLERNKKERKVSQRRSSDLNNDTSIIKRINYLERDLNDVLVKLNESNTKNIKAKADKNAQKEIKITKEHEAVKKAITQMYKTTKDLNSGKYSFQPKETKYNAPVIKEVNNVKNEKVTTLQENTKVVSETTEIIQTTRNNSGTPQDHPILRVKEDDIPNENETKIINYDGIDESQEEFFDRIKASSSPPQRATNFTMMPNTTANRTNSKKKDVFIPISNMVASTYLIKKNVTATTVDVNKNIGKNTSQNFNNVIRTNFTVTTAKQVNSIVEIYEKPAVNVTKDINVILQNITEFPCTVKK